VNIELGTKTMLEEQKTKLIDMMEKKIKQLMERNKVLETKNKEILEKQTNDAQNKSPEDLSAHEAEIKELKSKLADQEDLNSNLQSNNSQLRKMLNSIEEKGAKVANIAKEKVHKYSDENKVLKGDIDKLRELVKEKEQKELGKDKQITELQKTIADVEVEKAQDKETLQSALETAAAKENDVKSLQQSVSTLAEKYSSIESDGAASQKEFGAFVQENVELKSALSQSQGAQSLLESQNLELRQKIQELERGKTEAEEDRDATKASLEQTSIDMTQLKQQVADAHTAVHEIEKSEDNPV